MAHEVNGGKQRQWRSRMRRFMSSGRTVVEFCAAEGISVPSFYQWRKRLGTAPGSGQAEERGRGPFLPVRVTPVSAIELHLPNGTRICLPGGDAEALRVAIESAGRVSPFASREAAPC